MTSVAEYQTHYEGFDVMREEEHWDPHTQGIVANRLETDSFRPYRYLTEAEGGKLARLCGILLDDDRASVLSYVVHHFDSTLGSDIGESQRKLGMPERPALVREGLGWLDRHCGEQFGGTFADLNEEARRQTVRQIAQGSLSFPSGPAEVPAKEWLDRVLADAVAAYYSHPSVWSEIGYAGPAYPRGYVRSELGLTDPWEAERS